MNTIGMKMIEDDELKIVTTNGLSSISGLGAITTSTINSGAGTGGIITNRPSTEMILDRYALNELVVQHRVQEQELMKLRETDVDYAEHIKQNLAKTASDDVMRKMTFTKKKEVDSDTHSFRGRVWVFSKEELLQMIEEIRNGI